MTEAEAKHQEKRPAQKQRPGRRRPGLRFQLTLAFCALSVALLHFRGSHSVLMGSGKQQGAGQPRLPYELVLGLTHHKTGTSQMGCLLYHFAYALNLSTPVYQDNFVLAGNINMHMTRTPHDAQRPLAFLSGHELMKQCYYQNATKHWVICPNQFPCTLGGKPVLGLADCYLTLPAVNLAVLHFVRNPLDLFLSAFLYHTQDPPPEKWIETMKVPTYLPFLERRGVPMHRLEALGMSKGAPADLSYGQLLRSLPPERGVQLEFWRTVPMVYGMAQQYAMLQGHPAALQVRFEDLRFRFNATVREIAERVYAPYSPDNLLAAAHAAKCDPATWDAKKRASDQHVTWGKDEGRTAGLRASLMRDKSIRRHVCLLQAALGYQQEPDCREDGRAEE